MTSVGTNQFTVKDRNGRVATVLVDSGTFYQQEGGSNPGFSNITTGMKVGVYGYRQARAKGETGAAFTMTALQVTLPQLRPRHAVATGSITALSASSITIQTSDGNTVTASIVGARRAKLYDQKGPKSLAEVQAQEQTARRQLEQMERQLHDLRAATADQAALGDAELDRLREECRQDRKSTRLNSSH